jgi:uncharacterized protein (DUF58 family)
MPRKTVPLSHDVGTTYRDVTHYLDPRVLSKITNLELLARLVVEGFLIGLHRSPYHGFSVEFSSYRQYMQGDDLKFVDWKVWGRTDQLYLKLFAEETNLRSYILLDTSASMGYGSGITKYQYGIYLAAALSYLMLMQKDAVGVATFDTEIRNITPPKSRWDHLFHILRILDNLKVGKRTRFASSLHMLAERFRKRGLVVVISDLFDEGDEIIRALRHFRYDGHEVLVFQVLSPDERELPFSGQVLFEDLETKEQLLTIPSAIRAEYTEKLGDFQARLRRECANDLIDLVHVTTEDSLAVALARYLAKRRRSM